MAVDVVGSLERSSEFLSCKVQKINFLLLKDVGRKVVGLYWNALYEASIIPMHISASLQQQQQQEGGVPNCVVSRDVTKNKRE